MRRSSAIFIVVAILGSSLELQAQPPANAAWATLMRNVKAGDRLVVTTAGEPDVEGSLLAIDEHSIAIEWMDGQSVIAADHVLRIRRAGVRQRHVIKGMLIGMPIGGVVATVIDQTSLHPSSVGEGLAMGAIFFGLPIGAAVGALAPIGPPLYEAVR